MDDFQPSSPSSYSLWSWSSASNASCSSRTSSVASAQIGSPDNCEYRPPTSPSTFCGTSTLSSSRTSPSLLHNAPNSASSSSIPDFTLTSSALSFSTAQFSRAPSTSSTTSECDDIEECQPPNFSVVVPGVYRSSFPRSNHYTYLRTLGLKSVLSFTQEEYPAENKEFFEEEGIRFLQIPMPGNKNDGVKVPSQSIRDALAFVLDSGNWPLLIHCNKGKHRTGCVVGCLRRLQNWSSDEVLEEYKRFSFPKTRMVDQVCITNFDVLPVWQALLLTGRKPDWLEEYRIPVESRATGMVSE